DAGDPRSGDGTQLRVRQLLLRDGLPRLAFVRPRGPARRAAAGGVDRLFAALARLPAAADALSDRERRAELPRRRLRPLLYEPTLSQNVAQLLRPGDRPARPANDERSAHARPARRHAGRAADHSAARRGAEENDPDACVTQLTASATLPFFVPV